MTPISKEIFGHWAVILTLGLLVALITAVPRIPKKCETASLAPASACFIPVSSAKAEVSIPEFMKCKLDDDLKQIDLAMVPPVPNLSDVEFSSATNLTTISEL